MKCDINLFKNDDIKFITFISIIHRQYMIYLNNYLKKEGIKYVFYQDIFRLPDMKVVIKSTVETVCVVNGRLGNSDVFDSVFAPYLTE